jgi:TPR repeat protein
MITCKFCKHTQKYEKNVCKSCGEKFTLTDAEITERLLLLKELLSKKKYAEAVECHHILADCGNTVSEREYAKILEKGELVPRDLSAAMEYYLSAAKKNDALSAYRYSRLISKSSDSAGRFWLVYSAILGSEEAYFPSAELMSDFSREAEANYFYTLSARCGVTDAIVTLAKRYYEGVGRESCPEYAKWYLDKLKIPPLGAIKLAFKLRAVTPREPIEADVITYTKILRALLLDAEKLKFDTALFHLSGLLSERGDNDALAVRGIMITLGRGVRADVETGIKILIRAAESGSVRANLFLGDTLSQNLILPRDMKSALRYYEEAGDLGSATAYETLGDIYCMGELVERDVAGGIEYYDLSAGCGSESAREKSKKLKKERERLFDEALLSHEEEYRFKLFNISASMGYIPAIFHTAECLADGIGTKINRRLAFKKFKEAATLGYNDALFPLGRCYELGIGTRLNYKRARDIFLKAEALGDKRAHNELLSMMERKLRRTAKSIYSTAMRLFYSKKFKLAKGYLDIAVELGHPKAIYTLGCLYEFGMGVDCDKTRAYELYEEAYSLKFRDPRATYKLIVLKMLRQGESFVKKFE